MDKLTVTPGRIVRFTPSERTAKKFKNKEKKHYAAIVTDVNENSVDLTVFGVGETVYVSTVHHVQDAEASRSKWDEFPRIVN